MKKKTVSQNTYSMLNFLVYLISILIILYAQQKYAFPLWIAAIAAAGLAEICREIGYVFIDVKKHK